MEAYKSGHQEVRVAHRRFTTCLLLASLLGGAPALAATYDVRVRWQPGEAANVASYEVLRRAVAEAFGAPEPGAPAMGEDGTLSLVVRDLDVRTDYALAVRAVTVDGTESGLSNELGIGYRQVATLVDSDGDGLTDAAEDVDLDRQVDPGETDPEQADTDGDGTGDASDACPGTAAEEDVNDSGCGCGQVTCDDGDPCNGAEQCDAGSCRAAGTPSCDDGDPCTQDACAAPAGCTHATIPGCGGCRRDADCDDGDQCNGVEICRGGSCGAGVRLACDDGNPCTTDSCRAEAGCVFAANSSACADDGNPCTRNVCAGGACTHPPESDGTACDDGLACNGVERCEAGQCATGSRLVCDDGNACTDDACDDLASRCVHDGVADCCATDADCADTDTCTQNERCDAGTCVSDPVACPGGGPCEVGRCDPLEGCTVAAAPDGAACGVGDACTLTGTCTAGECVPGGPVTCPDPGACATVQCDPERGCAVQPLPDGAPCAGRGRFAACRDGVCVPGPPGPRSRARLGVDQFGVPTGGGEPLVARASFTRPEAVDPLATGVAVELTDESGHVVFGGRVPATRFQARGRRRFVAMNPLGSSVRRLVLRVRRHVVDVALRAAVTSLTPAGERLRWTIRLGSQPPLERDLACVHGPRRRQRCRP